MNIGETPNPKRYIAGLVDIAARLSDWEIDLGDEGKPPRSVTGPCPRCDDPFSFPIAVEVPVIAAVEEMTVDATGLDPDYTITRRVDCRCNVAHPLHPKEAVGCGAFWYIALVSDGEGGWTLATADQDSIQGANDLASQLAGTELKDVRASAEKWLVGVGAIYALFGVGGAVISKDSLAKLDAGPKVAAACLAAVAVLLTVISIVSGYKAAHGWPSTKSVRNDSELRDWARNRPIEIQQQVPKAIGNLRRAVWTAIATLAALSIGLGIIWFGPAATAPKPQLSVEFTNDDGGTSTRCGTLKALTNTTVVVTVKDGPRSDDEAIQTASIVEASFVDAC